MRRLSGYVDPSDALLFLGAVCIAVPVYAVWSIWVWAYVGLVLIAAGVLRDLGRGREGRDAGGPRR